MAPTQLPDTNVWRFYVEGTSRPASTRRTIDARRLQRHRRPERRRRWRDLRRHGAAPRSARRSAPPPPTTSASSTATSTAPSALHRHRLHAAAGRRPRLRVDLRPRPGVHAHRRRRDRHARPAVADRDGRRPDDRRAHRPGRRGHARRHRHSCPRPTSQKLRTGGITRFRYRFTRRRTRWAPGDVVVTSTAGAWKDAKGNGSPDQTVDADGRRPDRDARRPGGRHRLRHQPAQPPQLDRRHLPGQRRRSTWRRSPTPTSSSRSAAPASARSRSTPAQAPLLVDASDAHGPLLPQRRLPARRRRRRDHAPAPTSYSDGADGQAGSNAHADLDATNNRTYVDVRFKPAAGATLSGDRLRRPRRSPGLTADGRDEGRRARPPAPSAGASSSRRPAAPAPSSPPGDVTATIAAGAFTLGGYSNLAIDAGLHGPRPDRDAEHPGDGRARPARAQRPRLHRRRVRPAGRQDARPRHGHRPRPGVHAHRRPRLRRSTRRRRRCCCARPAPPSSSATGRAAPTPAAPSRSTSWPAASASGRHAELRDRLDHARPTSPSAASPRRTSATSTCMLGATAGDALDREHDRRTRPHEFALTGSGVGTRRAARRARADAARRAARSTASTSAATSARRRRRSTSSPTRSGPAGDDATAQIGNLGLDRVVHDRPDHRRAGRPGRRHRGGHRRRSTAAGSSTSSTRCRRYATRARLRVGHRPRARVRGQPASPARALDATRAPVLVKVDGPPVHLPLLLQRAQERHADAELHRRLRSTSPTAPASTVPLFAPLTVTVDRRRTARRSSTSRSARSPSLDTSRPSTGGDITRDRR